MTRPGVPLALVVAMAENGVIGRDGGMPWKLPTDLRHFRAVTMGKPVVMGRKTFESIGRPLDGRRNIVVSRDPDFRVDGADVARGIDEAVAMAQDAAEALQADEIAVIGGGAIYAALIDRAARLHVTHVAMAPEGDTRFPTIDPAIWRLVDEERPERSERDCAAVRFATYERRQEKSPSVR